MTYRHAFYKLAMVIALFFSSLVLQSQDQDSLQRASFANFLAEQGLHQMAAEEYERLYYQYPDSPTLARLILRNYRKAGQFSEVISRGRSLTFNDSDVVTEYIVSLMRADQTTEAAILTDEYESLFKPKAYSRIKTEIAILEGDFPAAALRWNENNSYPEQYGPLLQEGLNLRRKSPWLAGIMSAVVPGTGRLYTRDYADGAISMIFIGGAAFQSYRRFSENGASSIGAWVYGALATGFYIANIYGSVKSAKKYNQRKLKAINERAQGIIDRFYL